jgi:hypothetical protein
MQAVNTIVVGFSDRDCNIVKCRRLLCRMVCHESEPHNSSSSRKTAFEEPEHSTHAAEGRRGKHMALNAACQPVKTLLLLSVLLRAQLCTAQPGILPPMPPLGFFGGLLDGLGLGDNTPPAPRSPSIYREPYASPAIQPQTAASASSGKG